MEEKMREKLYGVGGPTAQRPVGYPGQTTPPGAAATPASSQASEQGYISSLLKKKKRI